jgi:hypothetical protein
MKIFVGTKLFLAWSNMNIHAIIHQTVQPPDKSQVWWQFRHQKEMEWLPPDLLKWRILLSKVRSLTTLSLREFLSGT